MESETWKEALDKHLVELTERLPTVIDDVMRRMICHVSQNEYSKIKSISDPAERIETLLNAIKSRTRQDFDAFCEALVAVKQIDLAEKLKNHSNINESHTVMTQYKTDLKCSYRELPLVSVDDTFEKLPSQYISLLLHKIDKKDIRKSMLSGYVDELLVGKSSMSLPAMFDVKGVDKKVILVEGGPGMGKSTLAIKICKCWAEDGLLENYDAVILLPLRHPEVQKAECTSDLLRIPDEELRKKVYREVMKTKGERICFIFEGYDELPSDLRKKAVFANLMETLPRCTLVYTSRPEACRKLYNSVSRRINILGFEEDQIYEYIRSVFDDDKEQAERLISDVQQNHIIRNIMSTPINVAIICHIFSKKSYLPATLTELYYYLCILLIIRHVTTRTSTHDDAWFDSLDKLPSKIQEEFNSLCFLAYKGREKGQVVFSSKELKDYKIIEQEMRGLGLGLLLIAPSSSVFGREKSYNFLHLTLQEFCAAIYISRLPATEQLSCFDTHHCNDNFHMIWKFYSGLTKLKNENVFSKMLPSKRINSPYRRRKTVDLLHYVYEAASEEHFVKAGNHIGGTVYFRGCDVDHISCTSLDNLLKHSKESLQEFDFSGCQLSELSLTIVCESLINKFKMKECQNSGFALDISYNCVTVASLSLVADILKQNFPLVLLNLGDCDIKDEISTLCDSCKINMTLTKLIIPSCSLDASVMPLLCEMLEHNHNLKTLDLSRNNIGSDGTLCLVSTKNISITKLILHKCKQDSTGAANIGKFLAKNTSVVFIDLSCNTIGDDGVKELMKYLTMNSTLQQLDIKSNKITANGAASIHDYLTSDSPSLTSIVVAKNPMENGICSIIEAVKSNNVLKEIDFTQTTTSMVVSPSDMEKIILKLRSLKFSPLDDIVVRGLDKTNSLQNLQVLRGTDIGYRHIINSMKVNRSVEKLDFQHNQLSRDSISDLSILVKHSTVLKELILNCTRVELNDWFLLAEGLILNMSLKIVMIGAFPIELDQPTTLKFLEIIQKNLTIEELLLRITQEDIQDKLFMHKVEMQVDIINQNRTLHNALPLHVEIL